MIIRLILAIAVSSGIYIASDKLADKMNNPKLTFLIAWIGGVLASMSCCTILYA